MKKSAKILCAVLALVLAVGCGIGGTLAYLSKTTQKVQNTFTYGNLDLKLTETDSDHDGDANANSYIFIPGTNITKDPTVTVSTPEGYDDVDTYVFVKVAKTGWPENAKIHYTMAEGWTNLEGDIWYREVSAAQMKAKTQFPVIANNTIYVDGTLTKDEVEGFAKTAKMDVTAYAIQKDNTGSAAEAWAKLNAAV